MNERQIIRAPIYQQLNELLRNLIRADEFKTGDQFLTERQVSDRFGVSRATANKALSNLVSEGLLEFQKGVGTFVRGGVLDYDLRALVSFTDKAIAAEKQPSTRVVDFQTLGARELPPELRARLALKAGESAYRMYRVRRVNLIPVIYERRYVVESYCPGLTADDMEGSFYAVLTDKYHLQISGADQSIRAVLVRGEEAAMLDIDDGAAGLLVTSVGYLMGGVPLWWEQTLYRADAYEFHNRLGPIQSSRPATPAIRDFEQRDFEHMG